MGILEDIWLDGYMTPANFTGRLDRRWMVHIAYIRVTANTIMSRLVTYLPIHGLCWPCSSQQQIHPKRIMLSNR